MAVFSDVRPPLKGLLVVPERDSLTIRFQFNPSEFTDTHETVYSKHAVPGASHPVYQYGAGGERNISFTIYFDADIGYRNPVYRSDYLGQDNVLSLNPLLNKIRSLTYPIVKAGSGVKQIYSPIAYLDIGNVLGIERIECIVKRADPKVTFYSPTLQPLKAAVNMELAQHVSRRVTAQQIAFGRYT